ncbi:hypothetical protein ABBQ38_013969 [Trebouxia sp. C0009 RCD-2024]
MKRKRSKPKPIIQPVVKSLKQARKVTSDFHKITRQLQVAVAEGRADAAAAAETELSALGGRASYQAASELTTARHRTSKWIFSLLTQLKLRPSKGQPPLRVLEVGAVNAQLLTVPWLSVRAIDIRPCLPSIEQADLLMLKPAAEFDVVVCAMVLNCVPTAKDRGSMLLKMRAHLKRSGHAFIVIPLRCLNDSPFMTTASFEQALMAAGLKVHTDSQKLLTYCIQCMLMRISNCSCGRFLYGSAVLGCMPA